MKRNCSGDWEAFSQKSMVAFAKSIFSLLLSSVTSCGDQTPEDYLRADLQKMGFIPYETPLAQAGTGTLVGGSPYQMTLVAPPSTCFPEKAPGALAPMRVIDETDLPSKSTSYRVTGNARVGLVSTLSKGNSPLSVGAQFDKAQVIEFSYTRPKREYFDSIKLTAYYREGMPSICKDYLDKVGFISEALKVDEMHFKFFESKGGAVDLTVVEPQSMLEFGAGTTWQVINKTELVVTTPKYIGYRMGRLTRLDDGISLCRASKITSDGKYDFQCMDMFNSGFVQSFSEGPKESKGIPKLKFYQPLETVKRIEGIDHFSGRN